MGRRPTQLRIASNLSLPLEAITQTFGFLAKRGMGKTYGASVIAEEMLKTGMPVIIIDPLGVCWGLRSSASGKRAGLAITIFGGDHGDIPLESTSGEMIAKLIVHERISAVLDLSLFNKAEQHRFITAFAVALFHLNRRALHLMVDEADSFAPQRPRPGEEKMLGAFEDIVRRGRSRGLGVTLITQRSASLNKNVLSQVEVLIAMGTNAPHDRKAIAAWTDAHGDEEKNKQMMDSLAFLSVGEAWLWSPGWLNEFKRIKFRKRETFDSSATPKFGVHLKQPKRLAPVDIKRIKEQMAETIERAKQEDPRELKLQVADLKRKLQQKLPEQVVTKTQEKVVIKEVPVLTTRNKNLIIKLIARLDTSVKVSKDIHGLASLLQEALPKIAYPVKATEVPQTMPAATQPPRYPPRLKKNKSERNGKDVVNNSEASGSSDDSERLLAGERRMIEVLVRVGKGLTVDQVATLAGLAPGSGTTHNYFGKIRRLGYVSVEDKFVTLLRTPESSGFFNQGPLTKKEVADIWRAKLMGGERRMFEILFELDGKTISLADLGEQAEMKYPSGTYHNYIGKLRRNCLADVTGKQAKLGDPFFVGIE